jgi:hypothetical protein
MSINVGEVQVIGMYVFVKEVEFNINVFDSRMKEGVLRESLGCSIVAVNGGGKGLSVVDGIK